MIIDFAFQNTLQLFISKREKILASILIQPPGETREHPLGGIRPKMKSEISPPFINQSSYFLKLQTEAYASTLGLRREDKLLKVMF